MTVGNVAAGGGAAAAIGIGAGAPPSAAVTGLAQTGASIEEMVVFGLGLMIVGLVLSVGFCRRYIWGSPS